MYRLPNFAVSERLADGGHLPAGSPLRGHIGPDVIKQFLL